MFVIPIILWGRLCKICASADGDLLGHNIIILMRCECAIVSHAMSFAAAGVFETLSRAVRRRSDVRCRRKSKNDRLGHGVRSGRGTGEGTQRSIRYHLVNGCVLLPAQRR